MATKGYEFIGRDANGIARVHGWSQGTAREAREECAKAIIEYVVRRPDTGPVDSWAISARPE